MRVRLNNNGFIFLGYWFFWHFRHFWQGHLILGCQDLFIFTCHRIQILIGMIRTRPPQAIKLMRLSHILIANRVGASSLSMSDRLRSYESTTLRLPSAIEFYFVFIFTCIFGYSTKLK